MVKLAESVDRRTSQALAVVTWMSGALLIGCGGVSPTGGDADFQTRRSLSMVASYYGDYLSEHGVPPKDEAAFRAFLDQRAAMIKRAKFDSIDKFLTSPRDSQPFVIAYGKRVAPADSPNTPWAAHERTGVNGKLMAARVRGDVVELTAEEIEKQFAAPASRR